MANILVVDDEIGIRALMKEILQEQGHQVYLAENVAQAKIIKNEQSLDLILLDIWMPETDGMTLLREWSKTHQLTVSVVMMSGHSSIIYAEEALALGAKAFIEKPIKLQVLLQTVHKTLQTTKPKLEVVNSDPPVLSDMEKLAKIFNFNNGFYQVRDAFEKMFFEYHLSKKDVSISRLSEITGLERTNLYRKIRKFGLLRHTKKPKE